MTKKTPPSLSANHIRPAGKNIKVRAIVWIVLVCIVTAVVFSVRQSRKAWTTIPPQQPAPVAKQDACLTHLAQCQQEKTQLALKLQETKDTHTQTLTFALSMRLAQQLTTDSPFATTLTKLQNELPAQPELRQLSEKLGNYTQKGVPTVPQLLKKLDLFIHQQTASLDKSSSTTWYSKIVNYVRTMVVVRPLQFSNCKSNLCRLYEAQQALQDGKLATALNILEKIPQPPALQQIVDDMRARAFVESYLAQFTTRKEIIQ